MHLENGTLCGRRVLPESFIPDVRDHADPEKINGGLWAARGIPDARLGVPQPVLSPGGPGQAHLTGSSRGAADSIAMSILRATRWSPSSRRTEASILNSVDSKCTRSGKLPRAYLHKWEASSPLVKSKTHPVIRLVALSEAALCICWPAEPHTILPDSARGHGAMPPRSHEDSAAVVRLHSCRYLMDERHTLW